MTNARLVFDHLPNGNVGIARVGAESTERWDPRSDDPPPDWAESILSAWEFGHWPSHDTPAAPIRAAIADQL